MRSTPSTLYIFAEGALQAFRATGRRNVEVAGATYPFLWVMARGAVPHLDPERARYATSDMVVNLAANEHIRIDGDVASASRLLSAKHVWKDFMSFEEALAHKFLAPGVEKDVIIASYSAYNASSDIEA